MKDMFSYVSYGLGIHSSMHLPELMSLDGVEPDVTIREGKTGRSRPKTDQNGRYFELSADEGYMFWEEVGGFLARGGKEIIVEPLLGVDQQIIRLPLLGPVLSMVLYQRGLMVFHASSVAIDGQAVAFLGASGQGKSTMAAALYARGHGLLADDLVVLNTKASNGFPVMFPGFPQLKLFPEAAAVSLGDDPDELRRLMPGLEKRARVAPERFSTRPTPLRCIYILEIDDHPGIEALQPQERIVQLIGHSYGARGFKQWMTRDAKAAHLAQWARVANKIPIYRLRRKGSLEGLSELALMVEKHFRDNLSPEQA